LVACSYWNNKSKSSTIYGWSTSLILLDVI